MLYSVTKSDRFKKLPHLSTYVLTYIFSDESFWHNPHLSSHFPLSPRYFHTLDFIPIYFHTLFYPQLFFSF